MSAAIARPHVATAAIAVIAAAAWASSLRDIHLDRMNDLGLISVMPPLALLAMGALVVSFAITIALPRLSSPVILLHLAVLILMLYTLPALIEPLPRFNVAWRHVGIADVLVRSGTIDPAISAYFSWPGYFALSALVTSALGLPDATQLLAWAPTVFNVLYLPPLALLFGSLARNRRVVWMGVWIFYVANWVGQDYFSPQAFAYLVMLWILALLLRWNAAVPRRIGPLSAAWFAGDEAPPEQVPPGQRMAVLGLVVLLFAFVVVSHQLTPFAIIASVSGLVLVHRIRNWSLPILMAVMLGAWLSYMTVTYLSGHLHQLLSNIGSVDASFTENITERLQGSPLHVVAAMVRTGTALAVWSMAAVGVILRLQNGRRDLTPVILAALPFGLVLLQSYGGEIVMRIFLFSLPFMALLIAWALALGWPGLAAHWRTGVAAAVVCLLLAGSFVSRYGNERMDLLLPDEAAGMEAVYALAEPGSMLIAVHSNVFWQYRGYETYRYRYARDAVTQADMEPLLERLHSAGDHDVYVLLSRSQRSALELLNGIEEADWVRFENRLQGLEGMRLVFDNGAVQLYAYEVPTARDPA